MLGLFLGSTALLVVLTFLFAYLGFIAIRWAIRKSSNLGSFPKPALDSQMSSQNDEASRVQISDSVWFKRLNWFLVVLGAAVLLFGAFVYFRYDTGRTAFQFAREFIYQNYRLSEAWSFGIAVLAATALVSGLGFILGALIFGRRAKEFMTLMVVLVIGGVLLFEFQNDSQCFARDSEKPLCDLYEKPDGTKVTWRKDKGSPPPIWVKLRTASRADDKNFGVPEGVRDTLRPKLLAWDSCGPGRDFFDTRTREERVFYAEVDGRYQLYDRPGYLGTGQQLRPITEDIASRVCKQLDAAAKERAAAKESAAADEQKRRPDIALQQRKSSEPVGVPNASGGKLPESKEPSTNRSAQYIDRGALRGPARTSPVAVKADIDRAREILQLLGYPPQQVFTSRFFGDGLFDQAMAGDGRAIKQLLLPDEVQRVVLIDVGPKSTTGIPEAQGASKENRTIRLAVLDAHSGNTLTTSTFVIEGVGFGDEYVQLSLQEDLAKKLERLRPRF